MVRTMRRVLAMLLTFVFCLGIMPVTSWAVSSDVSIEQTELNKLVGAYQTTADPEMQSGVIPVGQIINQNISFTLDEKPCYLTLDFGMAANVRKVEIISSSATTKLGIKDYEIFFGTENFGKQKMVEDGNEKRAQTGRMSKQDYSFHQEVRNGKVVHVFTFYQNAAGRYLLIQQKNTYSPATFVIENIGSDVRAFGDYVITGDAFGEATSTDISINSDVLVDDMLGNKSFSQLGSGAHSAFDTKDASLILDMGKQMAIKGIVLRASNEALEIAQEDVALYYSSDGETYGQHNSFSLAQSIENGRRVLNFIVNDTIDVEKHLIGRYLKICYVGNNSPGEFKILNKKEDIKVSIDPFGLPGGDPERRVSINTSVSAAYFDGRFLGEYGQAALDIRNAMSVENFVIYYLDNLNNNFNYLYRWENVGEYFAADNKNSSVALKLPSIQKVNQIMILSTRNLATRIAEGDWKLSYSVDQRNFTIINPEDITFRETVIDGNMVHILDFPEIDANTVLVYTTYTTDNEDMPSGKFYFQVKSDTSSYKAYKKVAPEEVFYETPISVKCITGDIDPKGMLRNSLFIDMGETQCVKDISLAPLNPEEIVSAANFSLQYYDETNATFVEVENCSIKTTVENNIIRHLFSYENQDIPLTRYIILNSKDNSDTTDYFAQKYMNDIKVHIDPFALPGAPDRVVSLDTSELPLNRGGFAHNADYLPSLPNRAAVWEAITAEPTPEAMFKTALENGVSIGWAYRIKTLYVIDEYNIRQSMMLWWSNAKQVNRVVLSSTLETSRVTADDFYVSYSTNGVDFTAIDREQIKVVEDLNDGGKQRFTIDFPDIIASHIMVYTSYSLGDPIPFNNNYFAANPIAGYSDAYYVIPNDYSEEAIPAVVRTISDTTDPLAPPTVNISLDNILLDHKDVAIGIEAKDKLPLDRVTLYGSGENIGISILKDDYRIFTSNDNIIYTPVSSYSISSWSGNGKTALDFDFDSLYAPFVKILYIGETYNAFLIEDINSDIRAFSFERDLGLDAIYQHNGQVGYVNNDRVPSSGAASMFGITDSFKFDHSLRSIVMDLNESKSINYIKLFDKDYESRIAKQDLTVYVSDDNITYTKVEDFSFRRENNAYHLYNFLATGRYIKVHQSHFETNSDIVGRTGIDYYASFTGDNLQNMMKAYDMPLFQKQSQKNILPYGQGVWNSYKDIEIQNNAGRSLKTNLIYLTYKELGLEALVSNGKLKPDYSDIRFADKDGYMLPFYDDGGGFYVRLQDIASGAIITMYYDNSIAKSVSDGAQTFQVDYGGKTYSLANFGMGDSKALMLDDGRMMLANHGYSDANAVREVQVCFSEDNGQTFGPYQRVTFNGNDGMDGLLLLPGGEVMLTYTHFDKPGAYGSYLDPDVTNVQVYAIISKNNVTEWSEPIHINTGETYNLSTSNPIMSSDGSIYVPVHFAVTDNAAVGICIMRSTDEGQTWENVTGAITSDKAAFEGGYSEAAIVELNEGVLRVFFRQGEGNTITKLGQITSYDNGETWTEVEQSQFYATCTQPALYKLESGRILLMWAGHNGTGSDTYQRMPITLVYSDDNGETWEGYQEISGRTMFNVPFGHPMAMQPDFCVAPDGSIFVMIWMRGTIYSSANNGAWFAFRVEDFDKWMDENTGAFDDFEQASAVKGNYWYEMGPRVGMTEEKSVGGTKSLRIYDGSKIDNAMAVRNFTGVKDGVLGFKFNFNSADSGLRFGLWECMPVFPDNAGQMFEIDVDTGGMVSFCNQAGALIPLGITLERDRWYDIKLKFDVGKGICELWIDGEEVGAIPYTEEQNIIAYFAAYSMGVEGTGTEFYIDDFFVIDNKDVKLSVYDPSQNQQPVTPIPPIEKPKEEKPKEEESKEEEPKDEDQPEENEEIEVLFEDISGWAEEYIIFLAKRGIIKGKSEKEFAPKDKVTRAEFVTMLARMSKTDVTGLKSEFEDVGSTSWYSPYVAWAAKVGITLGIGDGNFGPDLEISREDMAVMIGRYAKLIEKFTMPKKDKLLTFKDDDKIAGYAREAVVEMQQAGIISGRDTGEFAPGDDATREEAAKMITILIKLIEGI